MMTSFSTRILPALYDCCDQPERWRSVLDQICEHVGARSAAVQLYDRCGNNLKHGWQERDSYSHAHASLHDRWINNPENPRLTIDPARLPDLPVSVLTDQERFERGSPGLADTRRRLAQIGLRGGTGLLLEFAPSRYLSLILHRPLGDSGEMDGRDAQFLEAIGPHLLTLARISARLQGAHAAEAAFAGVLDRLRAAVLLCTAGGGVRWHNHAAAQMIGEGAAVSIVDGQLRGNVAESRVRLKQLLAASHGQEIASTTIARMDGRGVQAVALPLEAFGSPAAHGWAGQGSDVALILVDPARAPTFSTATVMALFGLTPAEAKLAIALSHGQSLAEYAAERGVSVGTVRIQMKRILDKTDSHRQSEMVGKLYASAVGQLQGQLH